jgi:glyoxylase-like metal-dependent hydrolase (beta-lactamase superfamily II)/predicted ester cyclase
MATTESQPSRETTPATTEVVRGYFGAIAAGDRGAQRAWYHDDMVGTVHGVVGPARRGELIAFFDDFYAAFPDLRFEVLDVLAEGERASVRWRATGTHAGPASFLGFAPTGARVDTEGVDVVWVRDGRIARIEAYTDGASIARQLGALPPSGSATEARMAGAFNLRAKLAQRLNGALEPEPVAEGVWRVQGAPGRCTVYLVRDTQTGSRRSGAGGDGVLLFDAGARVMTNAIAAAGARLGGITRVVLGHGHTDHRGAAPGLGVPVHCHPDEVDDAQGSGGFRYWPPGLEGLALPHRPLHRLLHRAVWDGGPVPIAGTVAEGDDVAGFEVVHLPGHAPGLIALWRAQDRLVLCSDAFYTLDFWGRDSAPRLPTAVYNHDSEQARASLRKLAALEPAAAWPGHAEPVRGTPAQVRAALERAADAG